MFLCSLDTITIPLCAENMFSGDEAHVLFGIETPPDHLPI